MVISEGSSLKGHFERYVSYVSLLSLCLFSTACQDLDLTDEFADIFALNENEGPGDIPPPDLGPQCFNDRFIQPEAEVTNKIDILIVTDTSGSLNAERQAVADGIDAFVAQLPAEVDYNVGVILAHGTESPYASIMFQSSQGEPAVLKSSEQTIDEIRDDLDNKLNNPPSHTAADGGEAGLSALQHAFDAGNLAQSKAQGMFRDDAALAVIFVADENDVCYPGQVPDPNLDSNGVPLEEGSFDRYCSDPALNATTVLAAVSAEKGTNPVLISGIVYNGEAEVPAGGENELGLGYLDLIEDAGGISVDLANGDIAGNLAEIGTLASIKLNLLTEFNLVTPDVDPSTIEVFVDGQAVPFQYNADLNKVILTDYAGGALSVVDINYCMEDPNNGGGCPPNDPSCGGIGV